MPTSFRPPFVDAGLSPYRPDRDRVDVPIVLGHGHAPGLGRVHVLAVASALPGQLPPVRHQTSLDFLEPHVHIIRMMRIVCQSGNNVDLTYNHYVK